MNRAKLKTYAQQARRDFLLAVTDRARKVGVTALHIEPLQMQGDVAIINGQPFPRAVGVQRKKLEAEIQRNGFAAVMDAAAYTWFNRLMAIRYMELHEYLPHGYRVLSAPDNQPRPQILDHAEHADLPGVDRNTVINMKLEGTQDEALYRLLLLGQCRALHQAMPFLFEAIDDLSELLLPDNLLATDSLIRKMVREIPEADWSEIEIIGWLYQFYISEKKDEVIGKVVASEDIPAATQLFTPNWIVKYMVQNSLGRQWLATYPDSPLRKTMDYYIAPAAQTAEVQAALDAITPRTLEPESLTLIDPAAGSGHILVEAYDLLREIYLERGYRLRDIPRLILEKNLFGLDIDDRAAQMAGFALLMKARADDRRILERAPTLQVFSLPAGLDTGKAEAIAAELCAPLSADLLPPSDLFPETNPQPSLAASSSAAVSPQDVLDLVALFADAQTVGSLLTVPPAIAAKLPQFRTLVAQNRASGVLLRQGAAEDLEPFVACAEVLARQYDVVVANPPYMGNKYLVSTLKLFLQKHFKGYDKDLFSAFVLRNLAFTKPNGHLGFMSPFVWMFISSYENLRRKLIDDAFLSTLVQLEYSGFDGATVPICTYTVQNRHIAGAKGSYIKLSDFRGSDKQGPKTLEAIRNPDCGWFYTAAPDDFEKIPGSPIAYWVSDKVREVFASNDILSTISEPRIGLQTGDTNKFIRYWFELSTLSYSKPSSFSTNNLSACKFVPCNKGGEFRRWYGNFEHCVNWENNGKAIKSIIPKSVIRNESFYFKPALTWSLITSSEFSVRFMDAGMIFDVSAPCLFISQTRIYEVLAYLNSRLSSYFAKVLNPTLNFSSGVISLFPIKFINASKEVSKNAEEAVSVARADWDSFETSWDFQTSPLINNEQTLEQSFTTWTTHCNQARERMRELETENNRLFIDAYGLQDELTPDVPDEQITLARANREQDMRRLVSYIIGCAMGRYSLDEPGLVYAHSGNIGFDPARYATFPADADGILPVTETEWFGDEDTANRIAAFIRTAWPRETFAENMRFLADSLGPKAGEMPLDTLRRYLATEFYKNHMQTYKKRPIYWLFSSGRERAFQALVYLHRYHEGTLSRMRTDYVIPLQSRVSARIKQLEEATPSTTSDRQRRDRELTKLRNQQIELRAFDEKLRHFADQRIALDLDDGVKVNYGKFGGLLADAKAITGGSDE